MNRQELIERIEGLKNIFGNKAEYIEIDAVIELVSKLDEPETGHADEAPRYVKNILARLRELPVHDREVWLKAIMGEFEQDFSHAKWREGYEQGKWVGDQLKDADKIRKELNKPVIPQFVADFITVQKKLGHTLSYSIDACMSDRVAEWYWDNSELFARAWLDGYEIEKEKRYIVKVKAAKCNTRILVFGELSGSWFFAEGKYGNVIVKHTRKELEDAGFSEVFNSPLFEVEEVE